MVHRHKSTLPQWYAESKFLETEVTSKISDQTLNYTFGHLFQSPSNPGYRNGNQLQINFCHLEFPWDCTGALSDPPLDIPDILKKVYKDMTPRCTIDGTLKNADEVHMLVQRFVSAGYTCQQDIVDHVMCLDLTEKNKNMDGAKREQQLGWLDGTDLDALVDCNQRSFGYQDAEWLRIKLGRVIELKDCFHLFTTASSAPDSVVSGERASGIDAFAVVFLPVEKAADLALVHVVGTVPERRRHGLASEVLRRAISSLPASVCRVYLQACDPAAISLYKKMGFKVVGEIKTTECHFNE